MKKLSEIKFKKPEFKKPEFKKPEFKKPEFRKKSSGEVKPDDKWYMCLLPAAITLLVYSLILAVKGIYPFGNATIDYYDMAQQIAPFYYHVFDSLHGTKGFFYDWYSALGTNMAMSTSGCSNISPFNLFFLFINRASLLKSLSVFNGIKLMCMSLTMYFYLNKTHAKSPYFFKLVSSVGYAFCGFVLVLYITNQWVDIAVFFPLIMYFYDRIVKVDTRISSEYQVSDKLNNTSSGGHTGMAGYVITLAITIMASYYLGFMILIFLFLYTGLKMVAGYLFDVRTVETEALPVILEAPVEESYVEESSALRSSAQESSGTEVTAYTAASDHADGSEPVADAGDKKKKFTFKKPDFSKFRKSDAKKALKKEKKTHVRVIHSLPDLNLARLGIGTLISVALPAFILIPQLRQMLNSARFKSGSGEEATGLIGNYIAILRHVHGDYTTRWWTLLGLSLAAALIVSGLIRFRKDHKMVFTTISMILLMVLELFFESINLIWHFGSYIQYPIRNGFIIYFVFAYLACFYAGKLFGEGRKDEGGDAAAADTDVWDKYNEKWYFGFLFTLIAFLIFVGAYRTHAGMPLRSVFHITSAIMAITFIFYIILFNVKVLDKPLPRIRRNKGVEEGSDETGETETQPVKKGSFRPGYRWAAGVFAFEILCYGFLLFGKPDFITGYTEEPEQNGDFIYICEQLRDAFYIEPEFMARVKNPDESLNANYGFVLTKPALSNWTHMIAPGEQDGAYFWGYSVQFMRLLDAGGTIFSDALLGVRNVITSIPMDERLYELIDSAEVKVQRGSDETAVYYLYKPVYTLPFGVKLNGIDEKFDDNPNIVKAHNSIYRAVTGLDKDVASWIVRDDNASAENVSTEVTTRSKSKELSASFTIDDEKAVYFMGAGEDTEYANSTITVERGGEQSVVCVPTIGDKKNQLYPAHFNNNALYLGTYENEDIKVTVTMDEELGDYYDVDIIAIDLAAMDELQGMFPADDMDDNMDIGKNTVTFTQSSGSDKETILPDSSDASKPAGFLDAKAEGREEYMLLPMTYDKGWKVRDNGKRVKAKSYAGLFTIIPLKAGDNHVTMKFTPPGMVFGTVISIITLVACVVYLILAKIRKEGVADKVRMGLDEASRKLTPVYAVAFLAVMFFMYLLPVIVGICILIAG